MKTIRNKVQLIGHVGNDPEVHVLENGKKFVRFSLATNEYYINGSGDKIEKTYWHSVIFWNRSVEVVEQHVKKGSHLAVEGQLTYRSWQDESGVKHYRTEVVGRELMLL